MLPRQHQNHKTACSNWWEKTQITMQNKIYIGGQNYSPLAHIAFLYIVFICSHAKENKCKYFLIFDKRRKNNVLVLP